MHIMYIFEDFSGLSASTEAKVVSCGRVVDNTLLRHGERVARDRSSHTLSIMARAVRHICTGSWLRFFGRYQNSKQNFEV